MKRWVFFIWPSENIETEKLRNRNTTAHGSREEQAGPKACWLQEQEPSRAQRMYELEVRNREENPQVLASVQTSEQPN